MTNIKEVLEYTEEELRQLPSTELEHLLTESKNGESLYGTKQLVEKTLINSLYGALANKYFPLFNEDMAAGITGNGRYFIRRLAENIEKQLQVLLPQTKKYMIYSDTDSVYFHIEPFMNKFKKANPDLSVGEYVTWADKFEQKVIKPIVDKTIQVFSKELNAFDLTAISADREIIADVAVFTDSKKSYYARVRDNEGVRYADDNPYIKVVGLDIIKSGTPPWSKKYLKEAIPHILDKTESDLRDWVKKIKQEYTTVGLNEIAAVGGISNLDYSLGQKGLPIGARSALTHNKYVVDNSLEDQYAAIQGGDKCKKLFLVEPNKMNSNIVSFTNAGFVKEIDGIVDYDMNFEKNFMNHLDKMTVSLNYNLNKETESLDDDAW
jgi:hypothetical protein